MVDVEQGGVVGVEVLADVRMDARGAFALVANVEVFAVHGVHICRWTAQVAEIALEVGELCDGLDLFENAFLAARSDKLSLMGRNGAEGATAKTATMQTDGELDHLISWDAFALVFRMGQTGVGKVERVVKLVLREGLIGWVDDGIKRGLR